MPFDANDPETKAALKAAVEEAVEAAKGPLDSKNRELLAELKEARKSATITPEQLSAVEAERDKLRGDLTAATKTAKDATTAAEKAAKALETEQAVTHRLIAENGLVAELTKAGVTDPAYLDAVKALHIGQVKVVAEGDERKAMFGDKPLADAIKEWAGTDIGKRFVAAPINGGGGAPGGSGGESGKIMSTSDFNALNPKARSAFMADGGKIADQAV